MAPVGAGFSSSLSHRGASAWFCGLTCHLPVLWEFSSVLNKRAGHNSLWTSVSLLGWHLESSLGSRKAPGSLQEASGFNLLNGELPDLAVRAGKGKRGRRGLPFDFTSLVWAPLGMGFSVPYSPVSQLLPSGSHYFHPHRSGHAGGRASQI